MSYPEMRDRMLRLASEDARTSITIGDTIQDYQEEAMRFAFYPRPDCIPVYPALAMMGEIAELAEKIYDGAPVDKIRAELGDVLWYITAASCDLSLGLPRVCRTETWSSVLWDVPLNDQSESTRLVVALVVAAGRFAEHRVKKPWRDGSPVILHEASMELTSIVRLVSSIARQIGYSMHSVAQGNIDKLVSRRMRSTLTGSGDQR